MRMAVHESTGVLPHLNAGNLISILAHMDVDTLTILYPFFHIAFFSFNKKNIHRKSNGNICITRDHENEYGGVGV